MPVLQENIKTLRKAKGLSQEELAVKLHVVRQTISKWEKGLSVPDSDMLLALSEALEAPVSMLLGEAVPEQETDELKAISEKLEVINLRFARQKSIILITEIGNVVSIFRPFYRDSSGTKICQTLRELGHQAALVDMYLGADPAGADPFDAPLAGQGAQVARQEGFDLIAARFEMIAKIEKTHGDRFGSLADLLEGKTLFGDGTQTAWMCLNCGHIVTAGLAPNLCPVCSHGQGWFVRLDLAPFTRG